MLNEQNQQKISENVKTLATLNFKRWNDSLLGKDPDMVAQLYEHGSAFLPTLSKDLKVGPDNAREYFESFLLNNPTGEIVDELVHLLGEDHYSHSGLYNFQIGTLESKKIVKARFTFVWQKSSEGTWKILVHHSSVLPEAQK